MEPEWLPREFGGTAETFNSNVMLEELQLVAMERGEHFNCDHVTGEVNHDGLPSLMAEDCAGKTESTHL